MLTALARCWSAALTPTWCGSTTSAMSRSPPARRAVTVPDAATAAMEIPSPSSPAAGGAAVDWHEGIGTATGGGGGRFGPWAFEGAGMGGGSRRTLAEAFDGRTLDRNPNARRANRRGRFPSLPDREDRDLQ